MDVNQTNRGRTARKREKGDDLGELRGRGGIRGRGRGWIRGRAWWWVRGRGGDSGRVQALVPNVETSATADRQRADRTPEQGGWQIHPLAKI